MSERLIAVYEVAGPAAEAEKTARAIAYEETVEVPLDFPLKASIRENVVGRVAAVAPTHEGRWRVEVDFPAALAGGRLGAFLNLVYGNASLWTDVRLVDVRFPASFLGSFSGPNFGLRGLRELLGVQGRPLLATALKPMGSTNEEFAAAAAAFARGGGDIVKDDQNIVDTSLESFRSRVDAIAKALSRENKSCLYFPHLSAPQEELEERLKFILDRGLRGVLICPAIVGLDTLRRLAASHRAVFMAHPAYSGAFYAQRSQGIEHSLYLGTLMRLAGADISVFPNAGGRFSFTRDECLSITAKARAPFGHLAAMWPAPGGGMGLGDAETMAADFGTDAIWLVGGRLLMHAGGPEAGARAFREKVLACASGA
ncbi:MAG: RuBisCO large subunit C-terminal-like domain-containing protein [Elusimicrobiota bacterium]